MLRTFLLLLCMLSAQMATAQSTGNETVTINGTVYHKGYRSSGRHLGATHFSPAPRDVPASYDAQDLGFATPVKGLDGQGSCGDCWAWSRTAALESAAILSGTQTKAINLSEEDTTDNATDEYGCGGGEMDFNYEISHGVSLTTTCPWEGGEGSCASKPAVQGLKMAYIGDSNGPTAAEMQAAIMQYGDVSVTVSAAGNFDVASGTDRMTDCSSQGIDHMVSLVGWRPAPSGGVEFKMKNSWGTSWGANGIAYMALGCNQIATGEESAMVVTVDGPGIQPVLDLQLPIEIVSTIGQTIPIQVPAQPTAGLTWSDGDIGEVTWVSPTANTTYTLTATDASGNKTSSTVNVIVSPTKGG